MLEGTLNHKSKRQRNLLTIVEKTTLRDMIKEEYQCVHKDDWNGMRVRRNKTFLFTMDRNLSR